MDELENLFNSIVKPPTSVKEISNELDAVGSDYFGSAPVVYDSSDHGETLDLGFSSTDIKPSAQPTTPVEPVGNPNYPVVDYGFGPSFEENWETTLEGPIQTYSEDRSFQADVVSFIERYYYDKDELPTHQLLHDTFQDYPECPRYLRGWSSVLDAVHEKIEIRGLPTFKTAANYLDPKFIAACHLLLNAHDKRSDAAKLKDVGIKTAQWNAWLKQKRYRKYYQEHAEKIFTEETQIEAQRALDRLVRNADLSAIKYVDERTNVYRSNNGNNTEFIGAILQAMFAILARNVPSQTINIIQAELRDEPIIKELLGAIEAKAS